MLDEHGQPIQTPDGVSVSFSVQPENAGLYFTPQVAKSDREGLVQTTLWAGKVITPVTVLATLQADDGVARTARSENIKIGAGLPDQDSISISAETLNPEAWNKDGVRVPITVRLADHANNTAPDGTIVTFMTSGGAIDLPGNACRTEGGECSVDWISQNKRPDNGRVVILAYAVGEESFTDLNGNRLHDSGEPFTDLPEPYLDLNENGRYDRGEPFIDINGNGQFDGPDGEYNGSLCAKEEDCAKAGAPNWTYIRDSIILVMSGSEAEIHGMSGATPAHAGARVGDISLGCDLHKLILNIGDHRQQTMPFGTTITASLSGSHGDWLVSDDTWRVANHNQAGPGSYYWWLQGSGNGDSGLLTVKVTTPDQLSTSFDFLVKETSSCDEDEP